MRAAFRFATALAAVVSLAVPIAAQSAPPAASTSDKPYSALPYTPSLDPAAMDRSVDPCGDFFAACMDEGAVEKLGASPLQADLQAIDRLARPADIASLLPRLQLATGQ